MTSPVTDGSQRRGVSGNKRNTTGTTAGSGRRTTTTKDSSSSNSRRVVNWSALTGVDNASRRNMANDDEEALKWAALERLPTYERVRNTLFQKASGGIDQIDVRNLSLLERQYLVDKLLKVTERDNERFLNKLRRRIDK
jgi:hypothetical protein